MSIIWQARQAGWEQWDQRMGRRQITYPPATCRPQLPTPCLAPSMGQDNMPSCSTPAHTHALALPHCLASSHSLLPSSSVSPAHTVIPPNDSHILLCQPPHLPCICPCHPTWPSACLPLTPFPTPCPTHAAPPLPPCPTIQPILMHKSCSIFLGCPLHDGGWEIVGGNLISTMVMDLSCMVWGGGTTSHLPSHLFSLPTYLPFPSLPLPFSSSFFFLFLFSLFSLVFIHTTYIHTHLTQAVVTVNDICREEYNDAGVV